MKEQKKEIKAIFFDIGGVLYDESPNKEDKKEFKKKFNVSYSKYREVVKNYIANAQTNQISSKKYFHLVSKNLNLDDKEFTNYYKKRRTKTINIKKEVEKTIIGLKKNYLLGTLTNIIPINHQLRLKNNVYKHFKIKLISCKEGLRKPDPKFYRLMIKRTKLNPNQIIFIDDEEKLLFPAKKLGINNILFKTNKQLVADLRKLGVKI